jgi:hypothetical protein
MAQYTCPMHPEILRDGPGDCPICGMALVPIAGTGEADDRELHRRWPGSRSPSGSRRERAAGSNSR